jgi:Flp pilus assembly protein TadD
MPRMNLKQKIRLFDILSIERFKLADLERRYQEEINSLNAKHLDEWLDLERKRVNKNDPAALRSLAKTLIDSGRDVHLKEAEEILQKLVRDNRKDGEAHYLLSLLHAERKHWQDAEDAIAAALRQAPNVADYHVQAGKVFRQEKKPDKAREAFAQAYRLGTKDRPALRAYAWLLWEANRLGEAEGVARKVVELSPKDDLSQRLLGKILDEQGRFAEAEVHLKQSVALDGKDFFNQMALAWAYYKNGQYGKAETAFGAAGNLDVKDIDAVTMIGLSLAEQARYGEARQRLQAALNLTASRKVSKEDEAEVKL